MCKHQWAKLIAQYKKKQIAIATAKICLKCGELKVGTQTIRVSRFRLDMGSLQIKNLGAPTASTDAARLQDTNVVRSSRTSNTILGTADKGYLIDVTSGTFTQTFTAAATLGSGWFVYYRNSGTGDITLDPNASETIDGLATFVMYPGEKRLITCDGSNFYSVLLAGGSRVFTTTGTFVAPPGISRLSVVLWGGGGGGGGGRGAGGGLMRTGGGGGGGGARNFGTITPPAAGTSVTVTIGAAGTSGAGGSSANGSNGGVGGTTSFGSYFSAYGGGGGFGGNDGGNIDGGGGGGTSSAGSYQVGGSPNATTVNNAGTGIIEFGSYGYRSGPNIGFGGGRGTAGNATQTGDGGSSEFGGSGGGGNTTTSPYNGCKSLYGSTGGGGGGFVNTSNVANAGGSGGGIGWSNSPTSNTGDGAAGGSDANGTAGSVLINDSGGGGGGGGGHYDGAGYSGGAGAIPGGGGGGGGGGVNTGGAGGAGGAGAVHISWW